PSPLYLLPGEGLRHLSRQAVVANRQEWRGPRSAGASVRLATARGSEVVVEAELGGDAELERVEAERGAGFEEDAALGEARLREAELAADEGVHRHVDAGTDAEAEAAADVDVDRSRARVDGQVVEDVSAEGEAARADVVVARVDARGEAGGDVVDAEVQRRTGVAHAEARPVPALRECGAGTERGHGDQGNQELAHAEPPNELEKCSAPRLSPYITAQNVPQVELFTGLRWLSRYSRVTQRVPGSHSGSPPNLSANRRLASRVSGTARLHWGTAPPCLARYAASSRASSAWGTRL